MFLSRRAARTPLVALATAALAGSVAVGVSSPATAFTPDVKPRATTIAVGDGFTLTMVGNGQIYATGTNSDGQLPGRPMSSVLTTLTQVDALPDATAPAALAAGKGHSVALGRNGQVYAVGLNNTGQLANGFTNVLSPSTWAPVTGLPPAAFPVQQIAAAGLNTYVLGADGEVYGAGWNDSHQISAASTSTYSTMTAIDVPGTVTAIAAGGPITGFDGFLVALSADGFVLGRGDNGSGQLNQAAGGDVTTTTLFPQSSGNATSIEAGGASTYIGTIGNAVAAVGSNTKGQLGTNSFTATSSLTTMTAPTPGFAPVSLAAGDEHVLVVGANGLTYGAGESGAGAVASGNLATDSPVLVPMEEGGGVTIGTVVEVAAGGGTSVLRAEDGLVLGSGNGFQGQLTGAAGNKTLVTQLTGQFLFNYVLPSVTPGVKVGDVATATPGSWSVRPTAFTYQWLNGGVAIGGATTSTYTIAPEDLGDQIAVTVRGTRAGFVAFEYSSAAVTPTAGVFDDVVVPSFSGAPAVGSSLVAQPGAATPGADAFTFEWLRDGVVVSAGQRRVLTPDDAGRSIALRVTAVRSGFADLSRTSAATTVPLYASKKPTIKGTPKVGKTLKIRSKGSWTPTPSSYSYQWLRNGTTIKKATKTSYKLTSKDKGKRITVRVTARKAGVPSTAALSARTGKVKK